MIKFGLNIKLIEKVDEQTNRQTIGQIERYRFRQTDRSLKIIQIEKKEDILTGRCMAIG